MLLPRSEAHVWYVDLSGAAIRLDSCTSVMGSTERMRSARFHFERDRRRFITAHGCLRYLLAAYTGCRASDLRFRMNPHGKPALEWPEGPHFNISHSGNLAAIALAPASVGVDVEEIRPEHASMDVALHLFSAAEAAQLMTARERDRINMFFRCWTRKESYIKALGEGLSVPLASFSVSLDQRSAAMVSWSSDAARAGEWWFGNLNPGSGYAGSLAVRCNIDRLVERRLSPYFNPNADARIPQLECLPGDVVKGAADV